MERQTGERRKALKPVHLLPKAECLNLHWFRSLAHAREEISQWRHHYNTERTYSALTSRTPMETGKSTEACATISFTTRRAA